MGLLGLFRKPKEVPLLEQLLAASQGQNSQQLVTLCEKNKSQIFQSFKEWTTVPEEIRADQRRMNTYCQCLITIASLFETSGDSSLMKLLGREDSNNPIDLWGSALQKAESLLNAAHPEAALEVLLATLQEHSGLVGTGVEFFLPRTHGMVGLAYYRLENHAKALEHTALAKKLCEDANDHEGVKIYSENLNVLLAQVPCSN